MQATIGTAMVFTSAPTAKEQPAMSTEAIGKTTTEKEKMASVSFIMMSIILETGSKIKDMVLATTSTSTTTKDTLESGDMT